jgi:hypothetical protein
VCEGTGKRRILMDARFPDDIKQQIRASAIHPSPNLYAALTGQRNNAGVSALSQLGLF